MADNQEQLEEIKQRLKEAGEILWSDKVKELDDNARLAIKRDEKNLLLEYAENLPRHPMTRCPFCETEISLTMDIGGLHGPWWWKRFPAEGPPNIACDHFLFYQGAMNFEGRAPTEATETVMVGPAAPFIIERVLANPKVHAVLNHCQSLLGDNIYLISYFGESHIDPLGLHQNWLREKLPIPNDAGEISFAETFLDEWVFDLQEWFESQKLLWIEPGDNALRLRTGSSNPYAEIRGTEMKQVISNGVLKLWEPPRGQQSSIYERP